MLTNKGFRNGSRNCRHKKENSRDKRTHVLRCFRESIFETSDGGKDFTNSNKDVTVKGKNIESSNVKLNNFKENPRSSLDPDVEWRNATIGGGRVISTRTRFVDVVLNNYFLS